MARASNVSLMCDDVANKCVTDALGQLPDTTSALRVPDDLGFLSNLPNQTRLDFMQASLYDKPFWLSPTYQTGAKISQQIGFVLDRLVPDCEDELVEDAGEASGANPQWISVSRHFRRRVGKDEIWKIRCFGWLRFFCQMGAKLNGTSPEARRPNQDAVRLSSSTRGKGRIDRRSG